MKEFWIEELNIKNYRGFENATFPLNKQMNVFAGKNGSGKTTVLEALNVMLGAYLAAFKTYVPSQHVFNITSDDPHKAIVSGVEAGVMQTGGIPQYPCTIQSKMHWNAGKETNVESENHIINFKRTVMKEGARTKFDGTNPMQADVVSWEKKISKADNSDKDIILPIVLYLSSARLWNDNSAKLKEEIPKRTDGYIRCLNSKHGLELAFDYIRKLRDVAQEENDGNALGAYEAILGAVNKAMKEELSEGESVIFSTRFSKDIVALKTAEGVIVPFRSLSDGYRNVIRIVLDIATRMCILNPYQKEKALENTPGIVLIDEIDLSLHPTWQKRILRTLREIFPKVQFICATHSPFIIQSLGDGELMSLDQEIESKYSGEGIEDISEEIMGVEMPQYSEKKRKMYLVAKEYMEAVQEGKNETDLEELRVRLMRLQAEYADNPAFMALIKQKYSDKEWDIRSHETD